MDISSKPNMLKRVVYLPSLRIVVSQLEDLTCSLCPVSSDFKYEVYEVSK